MDFLFDFYIGTLWLITGLLGVAAVICVVAMRADDELDDLMDDTSWRLSHYHEETFK